MMIQESWKQCRLATLETVDRRSQRDPNTHFYDLMHATSLICLANIRYAIMMQNGMQKNWNHACEPKAGRVGRNRC